jgi:CBS domain-containing protein
MIHLKQLLEKKGADAVTVAASASVGAAIRTMYKHRVGSVVIQADSGMPIGILTERDIMCLCAEGKTDFENMSLKDCMTTELVVGKPEDKVTEVLGIMTAKRFRHMPVVKDGQLVGLVSIGDLVKATLEETAQEAEALRNYITS